MTKLIGGDGALLLTTLVAPTAHNLDIFIFVSFLVVILGVGLSYSRQVSTIRDYALGGKNFATSALVATIVATWFGGGSFFRTIENTYSIGLHYNIALIGTAICLLLSGQLASRMQRLLNNVSVAEAMGDMYGKTAQIITAVSGSIAKLGAVAIQFKVIARILVMLFHFESSFATIIAALIVILYSSFGGIKAVTFTDVIQLFAFGAIIPILGLVIWHKLPEPSQVVATLKTNPNFHVKEVISWTPKLWGTLSLLLYYSIPGFSPELFQRIAMAKNVGQARKALTYAAGVVMLIPLLLSWVGVLLLTDNPDLEPNEVVGYMLSKYAGPGLKGLIGIGVTALAMSTADSCLNASSVLFANDIMKPLQGPRVSATNAARYFAIIGGIFALFLAIKFDDLLVLLLLSGSFYMPIVTVPMLVSVLGFRTSKRVVLMSMATGFTTAVVWSICFTNAGSIVPGMVANLAVLLCTHYILGEPGGWQKVQPGSPLALERAARKEAWQRRIKAFRLYPYLQQNLPKKEDSYTLFGLYAMLATYTALYTIAPADTATYRAIHQTIVYGGLFVTSAFITFPIWPLAVKRYGFMTFLWPLGIAGLLFFAGMLLVLMAHFDPTQVMVLMINLIVAVLLLHWPLAIILAAVSVSLATLLFVQYTGEAIPWITLEAAQFRLLYALLLLASILIVFIKHQEDSAEQHKLLVGKGAASQTRALRVTKEEQQAPDAISGTGGLLITLRELLEVKAATEEGAKKLNAITTRLMPIAFQLLGVRTRTQDYLRLVDAATVRPKDMDKAYIALGATPVRANDLYRSAKVDTQAYEQALLAAVTTQSSASPGKVKLALELIKWLHGPVNRHSGEPFYLHSVAVAQIVMDYNTDEATILGALLHDTVENTATPREYLQQAFGKETAEVVDEVTHLQSLPGSIHQVKLSVEEKLQMLKGTENTRALYIKVADRMHNMRTIEGHKPLAQQQLIAEETMRFFVPLSKQLGLPMAATELEKQSAAVLRKKA